MILPAHLNPPTMRMRHAAVYWLASLATLGAGAALVCPLGECGVGGFDRAGLALAHVWRSEAVDAWAGGITWFGSLAVLLPLALLAAWQLRRAGSGRAALFVPAALLGAATLSHAVKLWVARPRPELFSHLAPLPADWSYPSAHAMQATALALSLWLVLARRRGGGVSLALALGTGVLLVGLSRIYLQVHYPSDVLAGALAAAFWVMGLHALLCKRTEDRA
ncbi:MAG: phosphatase PAP2 family protein [Pseudomonadota bacterium]